MAKALALFSGQGAQYPGMGKDLYDNFPAARELYELAGDIFGFDVAKASFEGTEEELSRTKVSQPAIFTLSLAAYKVAEKELPPFSASAGHSLGEYGALWAAGAYDAGTGMEILKLRTSAMERATEQTPGVMYAILGGEAEAIQAVCDSVEGLVLPVNYNQPTQTVISGQPEAAARAAELLQEQGCKAVKLGVSGAFHTPLMEPAAKELREGLRGKPFAPLKMDFYSNLTGGKLTVEDYPDYLARHMVSPVLFVGEVQAMAGDGIGVCVEFGPKKTGATLVKKNNKAITALNVEDTGTLKKALEALKGL